MTRSAIHYLFLFFCLAALPLFACGLPGRQPAEPPAVLNEPEVVTVVLIATETPAPEEAAAAEVPALAAPTAESGEPTVISLVNLNVRRGPSTLYGVVGALRAGSSARVTGRSADGFWWKIECPAGVGSDCWTSAGAQFSTAINVDSVAVAAAPPPPTHAPATPVADAGSATPTATLAPAEATQAYQATTTAVATNPPPTATATQAGAQPTATATTAIPPTATATATSTTAAAPPTATATQAGAQPTATATATVIQPTATAAVLLAPADNDSLQNPARSVFFRPTGDRALTYSNDVSFPEGDQDDWVRFEFPNASNPNQRTWITLECHIQGSTQAQLRATVWVNNQPTTQIVICNTGERQLTVNNTEVQYLRIYFAVTDGNNPIYATYTLNVVGFR